MGKLQFSINLSDADIIDVEKALNVNGKYNKAYPIVIYNHKGDVCVNAMCEVYLRNLNFIKVQQNDDGVYE